MNVRHMNAGLVITMFFLSVVLIGVLPAEGTKSDLIYPMSQRTDYPGYSLVTPTGSSAEVQICPDPIVSMSNLGQGRPFYVRIQDDAVLFDGTDWNNAGGNHQRNGLSDEKGPLSAHLVWSGARSSLISWLPVTEGNRLFVIRQAGWPGASHDSPIVAMDLSTGEELWSVEIPYHTNDWTTWVGGVKNSIVYASRSGNGASVSDNLYALNANNGSTLWVSTELIDAGPYDGVVFASDGDPMIASFTDIWRFNSEDGSVMWHADRLGSVSGSCGGALFQGRFYVADVAPGGHIIVAYDMETGQRLYESPVMPGFTLQNTPFVGLDGTIYLSRTQNNPATDYFYAFTDTGSSLVEKWHRACAWTTFSEFAASQDGSVYCVLPGPRIGKLDAQTGDILVQSEVLEADESYLSPHFAVDKTGTVFFSNGGFEEGKATVFTTTLVPIWNTSMTNINIGGPSLGLDGVLLLCGTGTNMRAYQNALPALDINVTKVFPRMTASVTNIGVVAATNLNWNILVTGGILGQINISRTDRVSALESQETLNISLDRFIFGFGTVSILVSATCDEGVVASKNVEASVFLIFVKMNT